MAVETLTADTLVADSGTILSFSGGTFAIADLRDNDQSTGLTIGADGSSIDFSMSDPTFSSIDTATFNVTITTNGVNNKNVITLTALDQNTNFLFSPGASGGTGTFTIDITSLGLTRITNTNFRLSALQAITNISEVSITLNFATAGRVTINSGQVKIESGKVTI